jgi:DnaJ-domain-containing protein 1
MTHDCFALLNEPRLPWLDPEALNARFLALSSEVHPDRYHTASEPEKQRASQHYTALNTARQCLADPRERLLHLLELELGVKPPNVQRIPPGTMDLFMEVGQRCREVDAFLAQRSEVTSPLLKVGLFEKGLEWTEALQALQQAVNAKQDALLAELKDLNTAWESAPPIGTPGRAAALPLERLEQIYRVLSYTARWTEQLQERVVRLATG